MHAGDDPFIELRMKQLEMVQQIIARMALASASQKSHCIAVVSGVMALAAVLERPALLVVAAFPILAFWILDGYYLKVERRFRKVFSKCASRSLSDDFKLDFSNIEVERISLLRACISWSVSLFYMSALLLVLLVFCSLGVIYGQWT